MKDDLANLFRWHTKVDIKDKDGNIAATMYIKLVGDVDYSQAQQYGLLSSRKLRKRLHDKDSTEYQALFLDVDEREKDDLIFGILFAEISNFRDLAVAELGDTIFDIKLPDDATLEDKEKQQEAEENFVKEKTNKLRAKMEEESNKRKVELEKLPVEKLRQLFVDSSTNYRCLEEFGIVYRDYCIFAGTYNDYEFKEKAFSSYDNFRNISSNLKRQLTDAYLKLELTGDQLKN